MAATGATALCADNGQGTRRRTMRRLLATIAILAAAQRRTPDVQRNRYGRQPYRPLYGTDAALPRPEE